jgi:DNA-binding LytR/AlgR family response regulator
MQFYEKTIPDYLIRRRNLVRLVLFTAVFALAFINIYDPFGVDTYLELDGIRLFLYSSFVILTGMLVVVLSRIIMYLYGKFGELQYWHYVLWVFAEILVMAFVYSIYVKFILVDEREFMEIATVSIKNTALIILLPYTILWLFFAWQDKTQRLQELEEKENLPPGQQSGMIPFRDEKGSLRFSVQHQDMLYLEAADNYVNIYYLDRNKPNKFMVRNSMKAYEEQFKDSKIVRCHRSYMVNLDKVKIIRKETDGLHLELGIEPSVSLLVSKTYVQKVLESFSATSPPGA